MSLRYLATSALVLILSSRAYGGLTLSKTSFNNCAATNCSSLALTSVGSATSTSTVYEIRKVYAFVDDADAADADVETAFAASCARNLNSGAPANKDCIVAKQNEVYYNLTGDGGALSEVGAASSNAKRAILNAHCKAFINSNDTPNCTYVCANSSTNCAADVQEEYYNCNCLN